MATLRKSSSFSLSPKKRLSLGVSIDYTTPLTRRQSFNAPLSRDNFLVGAQNNDEAERKARQLSRLQTLQVRKASPTTIPNDRRKSLNTFGGLTNQQLVEHYSKCIQLSAENKINTKNAFNLQLIDYMTEMLKRKDSEMNNFQVASCTLDASTKIYAYRVDNVHTDTLKMAGGLGRTKDKPGGEEIEQGDVEAGLVSKKRKIGRHCTPLEKNLKNISIPHFDLEFDVDPLFKRMASQFDEGSSGGNHFLNTLQLLDDTCQLILDSETILLQESLSSLENQSQVSSIPPLPESSRLISKKFSTFEFCTWQLNAEDPFSDTVKAFKHSEDGNADDHAFDMNAIPEPIDMDDMDRDDFDCTAEDKENNGTVNTIGIDACREAGHPRPPPPQMEILHLKDHLASAPLEYSYFDTSRMSAWAGPGHWKLKPLLISTNKKVKSKDGLRKDCTVNYLDNQKIDSHFEVLRRATKLTQNTVKRWAFDNTTLPVDLHYNPNQLCKLHIRPTVVIRRQQTSATADVEVDEYNYDNKNDKENFCPDVEDCASNYDDGAAPCYDDTAVFSQTMLQSQQKSENAAFDEATKDFLGDNLVEAPNKVAKILIGYAKTAKKIDMRKLKTSMWNLLSDPNSEDKENKANVGDEMNASTMKETMDSDQKINFSSLYSLLKPRLHSKMAENLSVPLAFIALLHLANERNLQLDTFETLGDFIIHQN